MHEGLLGASVVPRRISVPLNGHGRPNIGPKLS